VAGLDALEGTIDEVAHRAEIVKRITNYELRITNEEGWVAGGGWRVASGDQQLVNPEGRLTAAGLARVLTHPEGGLKGVPEGARGVPFLNKVEGAERLARARTAARLMLREPRVDRVVIGAVRTAQPVGEVWRRVTAVVLAAGESRRMGRNKLLLPWGETTVLGQTLANVGASAVYDVLVVTGHERQQIEVVVGQPGQTRKENDSADTVPHMVHNSDYANGMLASVQAAVRALPPTTEAILVVLGDQPMVEPQTIDRLLVAYAAAPAGFVAPTYGDRRGNPVLIARRHFAELLALPPDAAPRALLAHHAGDVLTVAVDSEAVLHDLDRPEEYARFRPARGQADDADRQ
jgi:molybdenum cofactor cytidylyltransferase